jgi:hypothetical protein
LKIVDCEHSAAFPLPSATISRISVERWGQSSRKDLEQMCVRERQFPDLLDVSKCYQRFTV